MNMKKLWEIHLNFYINIWIKLDQQSHVEPLTEVQMSAILDIKLQTISSSLVPRS